MKTNMAETYLPTTGNQFEAHGRSVPPMNQPLTIVWLTATSAVRTAMPESESTGQYSKLTFSSPEESKPKSHDPDHMIIRVQNVGTVTATQLNDIIAAISITGTDIIDMTSTNGARTLLIKIPVRNIVASVPVDPAAYAPPRSYIRQLLLFVIVILVIILWYVSGTWQAKMSFLRTHMPWLARAMDGFFQRYFQSSTQAV